MKNLLKAMIAMILALSLSLPMVMTSALADEEGFDAWLAYCIIPGTGHKVRIEEFRPWLIDRNFPTYMLRNVTYECQSWNGTPVNALAIDLSGGVNLRSTPDYYVNSNIIRKVHGDETVFVYFRLTSQYGKVWYYGVTSGGVEGFMYADRIQLVYYDYYSFGG